MPQQPYSWGGNRKQVVPKPGGHKKCKLQSDLNQEQDLWPKGPALLSAAPTWAENQPFLDEGMWPGHMASDHQAR
jgi:hypothetical protein